jgi:hypothetical protein
MEMGIATDNYRYVLETYKQILPYRPSRSGILEAASED